MVVMGRVTAPFGVQGWVKIYPLTEAIGSLCDYPVWWLKRDADWRQTPVADAKVQGKDLVARFEGVTDRDAAAALKGYEIGVPRTELPKAAKNEFYWADLIGLRVVNLQGHFFGRVTEMIATGANDVMVVTGAAVYENKETLIPFIATAIHKVDVAAGRIEVDWGEDY
jgi:16S rRNA processing protein RimM